eukprot:TRINITY_DN25862_c0_g1_i1.p1 TRINITY_DN25862_c0_g1~~TRINITY_DN25862_c0_g1_i1.p1  ORF type:complete len:580 (+),score=114.34 TRINITY_DN25862_c0_g1_i1:106-1740(+)
MVRDILDFLRENKYGNDSLTSKHFPLTNKEFVDIFNFCYSYLNPHIPEVLSYQRNEEIIISILQKELKYPGQLSKTNLITMGSLHSWPMALGALSYLCERAKLALKIRENMEKIAFPNVDKQGFPINSRMSKAQLKHECIMDCYRKFHNGQDTYEDELDKFSEDLMELEEVSPEELRRLDEEHKHEKQRLHAYQEQTAEFEKRKILKSAMEKDVEQLTDYTKKMRRNKQELEQKNEVSKGKVAVLDEQIREKLKELEEVKANKLLNSGGGISGLNTQQLVVEARLRIEEVEERLNQLQNEKWQQELLVSRSIEKVDNYCREFNNLCVQLNISSGDSFLNLQTPVLNAGTVNHDPRIPEIRSILTDMLAEKKSRREQIWEQVNKNTASIKAKDEELKTSRDRSAKLKSAVVELETEMASLKVETEKEIICQDKNIADLKNSISQLQGTTKEELTKLEKELREKLEEVDQLDEFNRQRKIEANQFLSKVCQKSKEYIEENLEMLNDARQKVAEMREERSKAVDEMLKKFEELEQELIQVQEELSDK